MALLALVYRFQMFDRFFCVSIGLNLLTGFRVRERRLVLAIINGLSCAQSPAKYGLQRPLKPAAL